MADWGNIAQGVGAGLGAGVDTFVKLKQLGLMEEEMKKKQAQVEAQKDMQTFELNLKMIDNKNIPKSMKPELANANAQILVKHGFAKEGQIPKIGVWEDSYDAYSKKLNGIFQSVQKGELPFDKGMSALLQTLSEADTEEKRKYSESLKGQMENYGVGKIAQEFGETGNQWTPQEKTAAIGQAMQFSGSKGADALGKIISPEARLQSELALWLKENPDKSVEDFWKTRTAMTNKINIQTLGLDPNDPSYAVSFNPNSGEYKKNKLPTEGVIGKTQPNIGSEKASEIGVQNAVIDGIDRIQNSIKTNPKLMTKVGALEGRWTNIKRMFVEDPEAEGLKREVESLIRIAYGWSGKQISIQELERLQQAILPSLTNPDANFMMSLQHAKTIMETDRNAKIQAYKDAGISIGRLEKYLTGNAPVQTTKPQGKFRILKVE